MRVRYSSYLIFIAAAILIPDEMQAQTLNGFDLSNLTLERKEIKRGGPPRDGIPALNDPLFVSGTEVKDWKNDDRILGIALNGVSKAYPIKILDQHEIVNDRFGTMPVAVTYCPLCGSGITFDASLGGRSVFGVSGLLYNSDVLLFDRQTESLWSQILGSAVSGPLVGKRLDTIPTINTTWGAWKKAHPDTVILSTRTGHQRNYNRSVYGDYHKGSSLLFPVSDKNRIYHAKALVLGVQFGSTSKAYPLIELAHSDTPVRDRIGTVDIEVRYETESQSARAYDSTGKEVTATQMYWFAWYAFHPETEIYQSETTPPKSRKRWKIE